MKNTALIFYSLLSFPTAGLAWGLMWVANGLDNSFGWLAVLIRIITFVMQIGVFAGCLATLAGIAWLTVGTFYMAARGQDWNSGGALSVKGYMPVLLLPLGMGAAIGIVKLFLNWLNFDEHGLGIISLGYKALDRALIIGSLVVLVVWLVVLPIFLRKTDSKKS